MDARGGIHGLRVCTSFALEVAANFDAEPSRPDSPVVRAAYAQLGEESDALFGRLTRSAYRVVFTEVECPYSSDTEMIDVVRQSRQLEVTTVSRDMDRRHPLLDSGLGGGYDRFRAVHDLIGHVRPGLGFDRHGEYAAWWLQDALHSGLARWALATELHGENSVLWTTGQFAEHKAILLDPRLVRRSRDGCARRELRGRRSRRGT